VLIVPDFVRTVIVAYLDGVLSWISAAIYADLIAHAADHFLVALQAALDFAPLETACAGFHHTTGPGCRPKHPVPQLVRVLVINYCFGWSLRQLEFQVRYNLLFVREINAVTGVQPDATGVPTLTLAPRCAR